MAAAASKSSPDQVSLRHITFSGRSLGSAPSGDAAETEEAKSAAKRHAYMLRTRAAAVAANGAVARTVISRIFLSKTAEEE